MSQVRVPLDQLERRCQKPGHRRFGNWMAIHVSRPAALRVTWVVSNWGLSPNIATCAAWAVGTLSAVAFGFGSAGAWLVGAGLLQLWYLLDHVDGQLARLHGVDSLDGVQLDYLMHHGINLCLPLGVGYGLGNGEPLWFALGAVWSLALVLNGVQHDARYKAFVARLKTWEGRFEVLGGAGGRPCPQPPIPRDPLRLVWWMIRKGAEIHVVMNLLTLSAATQWVCGDSAMILGRSVLIVLTVAAVFAGAISIVRSQRQGAAEQEFALWYRDWIDD